MLDTVQQRNGHIGAIERARNSSVVAYMLHDSAMVADDALPQIYDKLQAWGRRERIDLLLYARGGATEAVWRLLNLLRENCDHLGLIVGTRVLGSAALLALGADEIVMGPLSELGGIESTRKHPMLPRDDLGQPLPVTWSEIKGLLEEQGGETSASLDSLYSYVHPLVLAHMREADELNRQLSSRALAMHIKDDAAISKAVDAFNGGFHSPIYTASRSELRDLGLPVVEADAGTWRHIWELVQLYQAAIYSDRSDPSAPSSFARYVCIIESVGRSTGLRQNYTQADGIERVLHVGWETAVKGPGPGPNMGPNGMSNN